MISIVNEHIDINVPENQKAFVAIGTSEIQKWAIDGAKPFVIIMTDQSEFDRHGFDKDDYDKCQSLEVGQSTSDFDFDGISVMRVQ